LQKSERSTLPVHGAYILVVGDKEKANGTVAVRARGNHDLGVMPVDDFARKIAADIAQKL
jgi:threonyl-tRNA synthetase